MSIIEKNYAENTKNAEKKDAEIKDLTKNLIITENDAKLLSKKLANLDVFSIF